MSCSGWRWSGLVAWGDDVPVASSRRRRVARCSYDSMERMKGEIRTLHGESRWRSLHLTRGGWNGFSGRVREASVAAWVDEKGGRGGSRGFIGRKC